MPQIDGTMKSFVLVVYWMMLSGVSVAYPRIKYGGILPSGSLRDRNALTVQILPQTIVQLGETAQLEIGHRLLVLLLLRRISDVS